MIRIKTLRQLISLTKNLVEDYYITGRNEYLSFKEHLIFLDVERLSKAIGLSERTIYDYIAAIQQLYDILCQRDLFEDCNNMTETGPYSHDMTDVKEAEIL